MKCTHCGSPNAIKYGIRETSKQVVQRMFCKSCKREFGIAVEDLDIITENVRLSKQKQRYQDSNRIERKAFRKYARIENAVEEYVSNLKEVFDRIEISTLTEEHEQFESAVGVLQISDAHFNELVSLKNNKYDFTVASKRIRKFVQKAKLYFDSAGITNVLVAFTGDLLNSDRRLDELLNEATNRSQATFLAVDILQQMLLDLNKDFNVSVASVTGNESRVNKDWGWADMLATDNYDFMIHNILKYLFRDSNIIFVDGDPLELVVNVAGQNLLLMHGNGAVKHNNLETSINQVVGRYMLKGIPVDYVILGHQHSCRIGDTYSRSSSLVGANDYSEKALNLSGRASQNCYIFYDNGERDCIRVDLQNADNVGYNIDDTLEAYNAKSSNKARKKSIIYQIIT